MMQSRRMSLLEAAANVVIGYVLAVMTQIAVFPLFGLWPTLGENLTLGAVFTGVSLLRSYCVRRVFENWRLRLERQSAAGS
jgi:hypothetical protein